MNTIIHYLKTRALRQITQWLIIAACSILILGAFAVADAYAQSSTYICSDLEGGSAGTCDIDEGCMDFDMEPPSPTLAAEICGPQIAVVGGVVQDFELHGWVWDTNLGYISLYCDSAGKNNGVTCGSIEYGVKIDPETGTMSGWAWSDNIGWVSFACQDGLNQGHSCGAINYETSINLNVGKDLGKITGYAWSDSVGWFDFETGNAGAKILSLMMQTSSAETEWGVWTKAEIEDDSLDPIQKNEATLKSLMPLADGVSGYDVFVHVAGLDGTPVYEGTPGLTVNIKTNWADTVKFDQTNTVAKTFNTTNDGPAKKALLLKLNLADTTTGGISDSYHQKTVSYAPTDGGNCYDGDGDDSCYGGEGDFFYKDIVDGTQSNLLTYLGADVSITIDDTSETWTAPIKPLAPYESGRPMEFRPIVDILELNYLFTPGDLSSGLPFIQAIRNNLGEFYINATDNGTSEGYSINLDLSSIEDDVNYVFINDPSDLEKDPDSLSSAISVNKIATLGEKILAFPFSKLEENIGQAVKGGKLISRIKIPNIAAPEVIYYYNNSLPRGIDSTVETQFAEIISGGVFSSGAKDVVQGSDVPLFGDIAVYTLRSQILGDVSDLIRGISLDTDASPVTIKPSASLYKNTFKDNRLYYFENQDVTIEDISVLSDASGGKPVTVVVKGGDLYIENNIDIADQEFGFIVFESDDDTEQSTKGGRIYVHSRVTDLVNVHMFADGPIFRYTDNVCYYWGNYGPSSTLTGLREPNFVSAGRCSGAGSFEEPTSALPNQFYLKGNIASFNCLGCSTDLAPSRGDGLDLGGPSASNFAIARLYDLHYFSYFRQDPITGTFPGARSTNVSALKTAGKISNENKAVYFEYSPAPTDLFGFRNF